MKKFDNQDIRSQLLLWLQPFIFVLLVIACIFSLRIIPSGSFEKQAYSLLIGFLACIDGIAYIATFRHNYRLSSLLTVTLALVGSWGSIIIDSQVGLTEFFPLIYVTITVLLSSVLLPLLITITIASVQLVVLIFLLCTTSALMAYNWASFITYVLIMNSKLSRAVTA